MILIEDSVFEPEKLHIVDYSKRLNGNELSMLLGFLIQRKVDFSFPVSPDEFVLMKQKTYQLMQELHDAIYDQSKSTPIASVEEPFDSQANKAARKRFFIDDKLYTEAIFYSGDGVYDFQLLDLLESKYSLDHQWLFENRGFDLGRIVNVVNHIKDISQHNIDKVSDWYYSEGFPDLASLLKEKIPNREWDRFSSNLLPIFDFHLFAGLFLNDVQNIGNLSGDDFLKMGWQSLYEGLIGLLSVNRSQVDDQTAYDSLLSNFSIPLNESTNLQFQGVGHFNLVNAKPIFRLNEDKCFIPNSFLLIEAVYESPFYWMLEDEGYKDIAAKNRGVVGENIVFDLLRDVFGKHRTFKAVRVSGRKGQDETDIDVLCVLGSKALCAQVKSKKLTRLARTGDDSQLQKDFQGAAQGAYDQGIVSIKEILQKNARFFDENQNEILLSEEIDEVYIMGITTENYPSLTQQVRILLEKKPSDPFPLISTIFDLQLICHYLSDPYDFLYYVRQRTSLLDYFHAEDELIYLGYHLNQKLIKIPNMDMCFLTDNFGKLVDRNYLPRRLGLETSDKGDKLKFMWSNKDFDHLCKRLKSFEQPRMTEVIFYLLDWSSDGRANFVDLMLRTKRRTLKDGKTHDFSIEPDRLYEPRVGAGYVSWNSDNADELESTLSRLGQIKKYKTKSDVWIGFGSLMSSNEVVDFVYFNCHEWEYSDQIEKLIEAMPSKTISGTGTRVGKKIGRNDACKCGSGRKFKDCCG